ncbi:hypothetical protein D9M73_86180 [compost metagenome]
MDDALDVPIPFLRIAEETGAEGMRDLATHPLVGDGMAIAVSEIIEVDPRRTFCAEPACRIAAPGGAIGLGAIVEIAGLGGNRPNIEQRDLRAGTAQRCLHAIERQRNARAIACVDEPPGTEADQPATYRDAQRHGLGEIDFDLPEGLRNIDAGRVDRTLWAFRARDR